MTDPLGPAGQGIASGPRRAPPTQTASGVGAVEEREWSLGYRWTLDAVRGVAIAMVLFGHAGLPWRGNRLHEFGVELFFGLSGFLITSLLLEEIRSSGSVDIRRFLGRRARRLMPALVAFLIGMSVAPLLTDRFDRAATWWGVLGGATYTSGFLRLSGRPLGPLEHLWSLGVEEHFYLVWPLLVSVTHRGPRLQVGRRFALWIVGLITAAQCWIWVLVALGDGRDWRRMYGTIDTRATTLLVGCLVAAVIRHRRFPRGTYSRRALACGGWVVMLVLSTGPFVTRFPLYWTVALPLSALASAMICAGCSAGDNNGRRNRVATPLVYLGRWSYGVYLWHYPMFLLVAGELTQMSYVEFAAGVTLSLLAAVMSYRWIEQPFRRHGRTHVRPSLDSFVLGRRAEP